MLKKTVRYADLNGREVEEDLYFHLSKADIIKMTVEHEDVGGPVSYWQSIINSGDGKKIMKMFEDLIFQSYGVKSEDGRRFIRTPEIRSEFEGSEAYSALLMDLLTNPDTMAAEFFNGIFPDDLEADMVRMQAKLDEGDEQPQSPAPKTMTRVEAMNLDEAEFQTRMRNGWAVV